AGQLHEDLVLAETLDDRLRDAEAVDAAIDDLDRLGLQRALRGRHARRQLLGLHAEDELRAALEVKAEVGLDLLVDLDVAQVEADARAVERERELVLRDI